MREKSTYTRNCKSNRSIAWGISESLKNNGAELAFTYQNDKLKERVEKLANECGSNIVLHFYDVSIDGSISKMLEELLQIIGKSLIY